MKTTFPTTRRKGFTLVELLTVIAIIGIVAAVAIPNMCNITGSSQTARDQRNAQNIVNTYSSGTAMGIVWTGTDRNSKIASVVAGQTAVGGVFNGNVARAPGIDGSVLTATYPYIGYTSGGDLVYDRTGGQSPN